MRVNVYAEELPDDERAVERIEVPANGRTFFGIRLYLKSADELHDRPGDDDRSAVTIFGPRDRVATLLRAMADEMQSVEALQGEPYTREHIEAATYRPSARILISGGQLRDLMEERMSEARTAERERIANRLQELTS